MPAPQNSERQKSPKLFAARSADCDRTHGAHDGGFSSPGGISPMASRRSSGLFAKPWRGRKPTDDGGNLKQLPSEDSLAGDNEITAKTSGGPGANDSSRRLNTLWEEDPQSKSGIFLSLLNIENAD